MNNVISYSDPSEGLTMEPIDQATSKESKTLLYSTQKLPDELIVEILKSVLGGAIPSRYLALVCKRWKTLLLETSTFWRKTRASFIPEDKITFYARRLRRRLELSQRALLDVTLGASGLRDDTSDILFELLGNVDLGRWRSLKLEATARCLPSDAVSGYFKGNFTSLKYLYLEDTYARDPYWPIYDLIVHSPPTITTLHTISPLPMVLRTSAVLCKVVEITIPAHMYCQVHEKMALETVHLTYYCNLSPTLPLRLPKNVVIDIVLGETLSKLDLSAVQSLDLRRYWDHNNFTINLPILVSMMLSEDIHCIRGFVAPALKSLVLGHNRLGVQMQDSQNIIALFQKNPEQILMVPATLEIHVSISTAAAIAVLSHWTQLEHVNLNLAVMDQSVWDAGFLEAFENSMCPSLVTLRLRTDWRDVESERWRQKTVELFNLRRSGPLELISWTSTAEHTGQIFIVTREDL